MVGGVGYNWVFVGFWYLFCSRVIFIFGKVVYLEVVGIVSYFYLLFVSLRFLFVFLILGLRGENNKFGFNFFK